VTWIAIESNGARAADVEKLAIAGGVELEDGRAELETLGPFGPTAAGVTAGDGDDGRTLRRLPGLFERADLLRREIEQEAQLGCERGGRKIGTDFHA
jgi:hypothetical protein